MYDERKDLEDHLKTASHETKMREMEERLHHLAPSLLQEREMEEWLHHLAPSLLQERDGRTVTSPCS
jgi:PHP family Zn ribbon phosphoesterase